MSTMKNNYMTGKRAAGALVFLATMLVSGVAFAAGGGGDHHGFPWGKFAASWVNFAIFAAILWKFALPPIQNFFKERRAKLEENLKEAERLREEAEAKLAEYKSKLDALEKEREELLEEYNEQGEREKAKIIADAKKAVEKMRVDAERLIEQEVKKAIASLEQRAVDHAVDMARQLAKEKLEGKDKQNKLVDRYLEDLESIENLRA
jgi:F-type H+-transporting ATPase subunit b